MTATDNMFTGEESNGRFLDLTTLHEDYLNLPGVKRLTYLQYLDSFDAFEPPRMPVKRQNKLSDTYLRYVADLSGYLESFVRRTKPLEDLNKLFVGIDRDFESAFESGTLQGWTKEEPSSKAAGPSADGDGLWCADCEKGFSNANVYRSHLSGKKHIRNAERKGSVNAVTGTSAEGGDRRSVTHLKEKAVSSHEFRARALANILDNERSNTRVNVERKQGMTERERQQ